jgi:cellulose synthase/poly-beta-1,6-N-acetylglucosamine synthase-like glycosyltransferase
MITAGPAVQIAFLASVALIWLMIVYQVVMTAAGFIHRLRSARRTAALLRAGGPLPPVSILIPARNEEVVIGETLRAVCGLAYPGGPLEIIVIDDGSTDRTAEMVGAAASKDPRIELLRLPLAEQGRGKSHALNHARKRARHDLVAVYDADNRPEPRSLEVLVRRLLAEDRLGAVLGKFRTLNRARNLLTTFIDLETLAFQWIVQAGRCALFGVGILPGTNFVIRRQVLEELDGWDERAVTEDTELSVRIYQRGWRIDFAPEAVTWEEEPERFRVWLRQRTRWVTGNFYVLRKFLFSSWRFPNKFLALQILYLSILYYLFLVAVLVSHAVFLACLTGWLRVNIPGPYTLVWAGAFLLFVAELFLVTAYEGEHRLRRIGLAALMYVTYCQAWLLVVFRALWNEYLGKKGVHWDKTVRFGTPPGAAPGAGEEESGSAPAVRPARSTLLLLVAALCFLQAPVVRGGSVLETILYGEPLLDAHVGEVYLEGSYETFHDRDLVGLLDLKDGLRLMWFYDAQLILFGKARAYKDTANEFWNNKALFGPSLRLKPFSSIGFFFFAEYLFGTYYGIEGRTPNPHPQQFSGLEGGAAFFEQWGELPLETRLYLPFTRWRELYWDAIYFEFDDQNFIANAQGKEGFGTIRLGPILTDLFVGANGSVDVNKDYWNNFAEGTVGVRLRPRWDLDCRLSVGFVAGHIFDRHGRFELPFDEDYLGARVELTFWFGWDADEVDS